MNAPVSRGPAHVPTLTEVVQFDAPTAPAPPEPDTAADAAERAEPGEPGEPAPDWSQTVVLTPGASLPDEAQLTQNILADLQRQIDLMLEYRLREAIGPALARTADALIREVRTDLAASMRELVARAVAQELARHRGR
jgi:hypothetical protein